MSIHIAAEKGQIAPYVLFPGDPLRAKYIADNYLDDVTQYSTVRNMFGYTGIFQGTPVSVQGSGMGIPSAMIYAEELYKDYDVEAIIRVGSIGAMQEDIAIRDIIIGQTASTDSNILHHTFYGQVHYSAQADFHLLKTVYQKALDVMPEEKIHVGNILSSDRFYNEEMDKEKLAKYGVLGVEMEAAGLYLCAAKYQRQALAMCTVSDHIFTGEVTTSEEREQSFTDMMTIALETVSELEV